MVKSNVTSVVSLEVAVSVVLRVRAGSPAPSTVLVAISPPLSLILIPGSAAVRAAVRV